jgi:hypothetical protein
MQVGNGHVAWKLRSDTVYAAGLFNGPAGSISEGDGDGRARIPPFRVTFTVTSQVDTGDAIRSNGGEAGDTVVTMVPQGQALDVRRAMFIARSRSEDGTIAVEERWYAPLHMPRVLVHEVSVTTGAAAVTLDFDGEWAGGVESADLRLANFTVDATVVGISGANNVPELVGLGHTRVAVAATIPPGSLHVPATATTTVFNLQAFVTSLYSSDVEVDAVASLRSANVTTGSLQAGHEAAWAARMATGGGIEIEGDLWLAQAANASLYFIRSSIRADWPHGLSPGGLASNGYG